MKQAYLGKNIKVKATQIEGLNLNNYSTTEQVIGKWIDGKPIYRKTLPLSVTDKYTRFAHGISNLDVLLDIRGHCKRRGADYKIVLPFLYPNWEIWFYDVNNNGFTLRLSDNEYNAGIDSVHIIIEYTKTTD